MAAILFDHDGTLVDSEIVNYRVWRDVLAGYGVSLSEEWYRLNYTGIPTRDNALDIVERFTLHTSAEALAKEKSEAARRFLASQPFPLMPGARESIRFFRERDCRLAVVSSAERWVIEATLNAHGLQDDFELIVSANDVRACKPAPECYQLAVRQLGATPANCVAFEDTEYGLAAAVAAGVSCVAIPNSMSAHHDFSRAAQVAANLHEATDWVAQHFDLR